MPGCTKVECDDDMNVIVVPPGQVFEAPEDIADIKKGLAEGRIVRA